MSVVRGENPGVAVLQDERVLVAGGTLVPDEWDQSLDSAELFVRDKEQMVAAGNTMTGAPRWQNSAVTLLTGKALVIGGGCSVEHGAAAWAIPSSRTCSIRPAIPSPRRPNR